MIIRFLYNVEVKCSQKRWVFSCLLYVVRDSAFQMKAGRLFTNWLLVEI